MSIAHFRKSVFFCLIATGFQCVTGLASDTLSIQIVKDMPERLFPVGIAKICGLLTILADDNLGGYERCIKDKTLIPFSNIDAAIFNKIKRILLWAQLELDAKDLTEIEASRLKDAFERKLAYSTSQELFDLMTCANYLDITIFLDAAATVWIRNYSELNCDFQFLNRDLKALIIRNLSDHQFLALMKANNYREEIEEEIFTIALAVHHGIEKPKSDITAKEFYKEFVYGKFVFIPGGEYVIGSLRTEQNRNDHENLCQVKLEPFWIMETVVTQEQYTKTMGVNPSLHPLPWFAKIEEARPTSYKVIAVDGKNIETYHDHPVHRIWLYQASQYADTISKNDDEYDYNLPNYAQLEVAFRGGKNTHSVDDPASGRGDYVWHEGHTYPVDSNQPNKLGVVRCGVREWDRKGYNHRWSKNSITFGNNVNPYTDDDRDVWEIGFRLVRTKKIK